VINSGEGFGDLGSLVVPQRGMLRSGSDLFEPFQLVDGSGQVVASAAGFFAELQACGRSVSTQRSYGLALLRWFRFLWAVDARWDQATRVEAREFCRWIQIAAKPVKPHWRRSGSGVASVIRSQTAPNLVTGIAAPGVGYAATTAAHSETVLRCFYGFHLEAGTGPMVNPFPLSRTRDGGRANAHHNPMAEFRAEGRGLYRPKVPARIPRAIPDELFNELFAALSSDRDRALVAFWVSTGARAAELLGAMCADVDPGSQLITVIRKGSRALQQLPASSDAFVWLRLYQARLQQQGLDRVRLGGDQPLWWTSRAPFVALSYHAAYRMFARVNARVGSNWSLHSLRHTAAYRMARDPQMPLTDVQWVLGHAHLSTTQVYLTPLPEDVIAAVLAHHERRGQERPAPAAPGPQYRAESLNVLFGTDR
jgi:site-specific recombinase XerC